MLLKRENDGSIIGKWANFRQMGEFQGLIYQPSFSTFFLSGTPKMHQSLGNGRISDKWANFRD
jgi:hypothetical protein